MSIIELSLNSEEVILRAGEKLRELINDSKKTREERNPNVFKYASQIKEYMSEAKITKEIPKEDHYLKDPSNLSILPPELIKKKVGRPMKEHYEKAQKIYPKLTVDKLNYFHKFKSKNLSKINGDSSRVGYLIEEYKIWDRIRDRYLVHIKNQIQRVDDEIKTEGKPSDNSIALAYDLYQIFGLKLDELKLYLTNSQYSTLKFCVFFMENRRQ